MDDDKAVLGARVSPVVHYDPERQLLTPDFITEEDFVTYLTWQSTGAVAEMFERNDVGWLLLQQPLDIWERDYNGVWLRPVTGLLPQHFLKMEDSELVNKVYEGETYVLYRVVGGDESPPGGNPEP
jgi:hypothetical protein